MGIANKLNSGKSRRTLPEDFKLDDIQYVKAKEIAFEDGDPIKLVGFIIKKGDYGKSITLYSEKLGINVPARYVEMFENMTDEEVEDIIDGKLGISAIHDGIKTKQGVTVAIDFVDM